MERILKLLLKKNKIVLKLSEEDKDEFEISV